MPRANRHYLPGYIWHITHRCHKQEFLLKFARDRRNWIHWLYEARKRHDLRVLNYMVTSNHVHLLVMGKASGDIWRSMQLIAGRVGQDYNARKGRKGAFWEDRYHATAIDQGGHFKRCLMYIDLNMVRARVVGHPQDWPDCGYHEILRPPKRYRIIDREGLLELLEISEIDRFPEIYSQWIEEELESKNYLEREPGWTESLALGNEGFVEEVKAELGIGAVHREVQCSSEGHYLKEEQISYRPDFGVQIEALSPKLSPPI
jgi:putative transposase